MAKQKNVDPAFELSGLIKKLLIIDLFKLNVSQGAIAKKLHVDIHIVNEFLKGVEKN